MTLGELLAVAEIVEKLTHRYRDQEAAHKAALTEIRASFNARTGADGKIIEWLRIKVQDARAERDALRAEVAALKSQTPKHPVKVGEWVRRSNRPGYQSPVGVVKQVTSIRCYGYSYGFADRDCWSSDNCEPCDPPEATHDTDAGKAAAAALKTEPVAEEIKVGDVIEVVSSTHRLYTEPEDIGRRGIVTVIYGMRLSLSAVPGHELPISGIVGKCDVRKVTT